MKILFIGSDRSIFDQNSNAFLRMREYGRLFEQIHIVIFNTKIASKEKLKISDNVWAYPTNSYSKVLYVLDAFRVSAGIINSNLGGKWVVSTQDPFESGLVGVCLKNRFKIGFQVQIHTDILSKFFKRFNLNKLRLMISKFVLSKADQVRVVSLRIKESLVSYYNLDKDKIKILPIFTNLNKFKQEGEKFDFKKIKPNWNKILLTVCRVEKEKNLFFILDILGIILKNNKNVGWVLVGEGSLLPALKRKVQRMSIEENVLFLGKKDDLPAIYRGADLYIQTSFFEGFGLSLIEAHFCGLPIVTTDVGAVGWILKEGEGVNVCNVDDADCFVKDVNNYLWNDNFTGFVKNILNLPNSEEEYLKAYKSLFDGFEV
jgi:glycosyltransferase involved in cell wall biosynthesis